MNDPQIHLVPCLSENSDTQALYTCALVCFFNQVVYVTESLMYFPWQPLIFCKVKNITGLFYMQVLSANQ